MRVSVAAEPLVVMEDDLARLEQSARFVEDDLADARMLLDEVPLGARERVRLLEDLLRNGDLAGRTVSAR
jgi:hypothetical protein